MFLSDVLLVVVSNLTNIVASCLTYLFHFNILKLQLVRLPFYFMF